MELISMASISQQEIEYLRNNINTGIEFEYALFSLLNNGELQNVFLNEVVLYHPFKDRIELIIAKTNLNNLPNKLIKIFRMRKIPVIFVDLTKIFLLKSLLKKNNGKFKSEKQSDFLMTQLKMHTGFLGYVNNGKIKNPIFVEYDKYGITKLLKKLTGSNMIEIIFERNAQSELHPKDVIMLKKIESILIEQQPKETITNKKQYRLSTYELAKNVYGLAKNNNGLFKSEVQGNFLIEQLNLSDGYLGQTNGIKYKNPIFF